MILLIIAPTTKCGGVIIHVLYVECAVVIVIFFLSEVNSNCCDVKIGHRYSVDILILIKSQCRFVSPQSVHSIVTCK